MSRPEQNIDQVLAGLRDARPSNGLEERILGKLEERSRQGQQRPWPWWSLAAKTSVPYGSPRVPVWITGLALMGAVAIFLAIVTHPGEPRRVDLQSAAKVSTEPAIRQDAKLATRSMQTSTTMARPKAPKQPPRARITPAHDAEPSLAMEEMMAPSLVAPPLPMTAQERALSRIGQRHRPDVVAALNAEHRARDQAQAIAEFYSFFEPAKGTQSNN